MNARFHIPTSSTASPGLINILTQMLEADPVKRISCGEVWSVLDSFGDAQKPSSLTQQLIQGNLSFQKTSDLELSVQTYCNPNDKPSNEWIFRNIVTQVTTKSLFRQLEAIVVKRAEQDQSSTTSTLKLICFIHRSSLYLSKDTQEGEWIPAPTN